MSIEPRDDDVDIALAGAFIFSNASKQERASEVRQSSDQTIMSECNKQM